MFCEKNVERAGKAHQVYYHNKEYLVKKQLLFSYLKFIYFCFNTTESVIYVPSVRSSSMKTINYNGFVCLSILLVMHIASYLI